MRTLKYVLETLEKRSRGEIELTEEVVKCQALLRESDVVAEHENGNVYVLKYAADGKLYALSNYNTSVLGYICEYNEYLEMCENSKDD